MQVHVVTKINEHLYKNELEQFYRIRNAIYAEGMQWAPTSSDGLERDQFDTPHAHYLIGLEDGLVICGARFTPTSLPHMLSELFPHLCSRNGGIILDSAVAEWTRIFTLTECHEGQGVRLKAKFCHATMEYMLDEGVTQIGGIQQIYWVALCRRFGWKVDIRGEPDYFAKHSWIPAYFEVSEQAIASAGRWGRLRAGESILVRKGPQRAFIQDRALRSET